MPKEFVEAALSGTIRARDLQRAASFAENAAAITSEAQKSLSAVDEHLQRIDRARAGDADLKKCGSQLGETIEVLRKLRTDAPRQFDSVNFRDALISLEELRRVIERGGRFFSSGDLSPTEAINVRENQKLFAQAKAGIDGIEDEVVRANRLFEEASQDDARREALALTTSARQVAAQIGAGNKRK